MPPIHHDLQAFECVWTAGMWRLAEHMLVDLDRVLQAHGIQCFMVYGTFLGAVRHQGVIPWDDDIDVAIFGEDESRLLQAQTDLLDHGYQLKRHQVLWDDIPLDFYKVWMTSRPSVTSYPYSWPFVDIWVLRPTGQLNEVTDGESRYQRSDLLPLKPYPFGNLSLAGPGNEALLVQSYGEDYLDTCVSSYLNHREEKRLSPLSRPRSDVQHHGYFVRVHAIDPMNLHSKPSQNATYQLQPSTGGEALVSTTGQSYPVSPTAAALWNLSDGTRTIQTILAQLADRFAVSAIDLVEDVYSSLDTLHAHGAVRLS